MNRIMHRGQDAPNVSGRVPLDRVRTAAEHCEAACQTDYERARERFVADNESRCNAQEASVQRWHERRLAELRSRLERLRQTNPRMVAATEGLIRMEELQRQRQLDQVRARRHIDESFRLVALGLVEVVPA